MVALLAPESILKVLRKGYFPQPVLLGLAFSQRRTVIWHILSLGALP